VATNHTNTSSPEYPDSVESQVVAFEIPADPTQEWAWDQLSEGIVAFPDVPLLPLDAPGTWAAGDVDDDGDTDLVVAGDGDPNVYLLVQEGGAFETTILGPFVEGSAGANVADLDGDGDLEIIVVSERNDAVFVLDRA
jgi:hypothetical protein